MTAAGTKRCSSGGDPGATKAARLSPPPENAGRPSTTTRRAPRSSRRLEQRRAQNRDAERDTDGGDNGSPHDTARNTPESSPHSRVNRSEPGPRGERNVREDTDSEVDVADNAGSDAEERRGNGRAFNSMRFEIPDEVDDMHTPERRLSSPPSQHRSRLHSPSGSPRPPQESPIPPRVARDMARAHVSVFTRAQAVRTDLGTDDDDDTVQRLQDEVNRLKGDLARTELKNDTIHSALNSVQSALDTEKSNVARLSSEICILRNTHRPRSSCDANDRRGSEGNGSGISISVHAEFTKENVLESLHPGMAAVYAQMPKMTRMFATETISSEYSGMAQETAWFPNAESVDVKRIRDWRGRAVRMESAFGEIVDDTNALPVSGAVFFKTSRNADGNVCVTHAAVPKCPTEIALEGGFYYATEDIISDALGERVLQVLKASMTTISPELRETALRTAAGSKFLRRRFRASCRDNVGGRKKSMKSVFFIELGYPLIFDGKGTDASTTARRQEQYDEAYKKLYRTRDDGKPITSWWRRASFETICADGRSPLAERELSGVDTLFANEPARIVAESFSGGCVNEDDDMSIMVICRIDAWMTAMIEQLCDRKIVGRRGGSDTTQLRDRYRELLVASTEQVLAHCLSQFSRSLRLLDGSGEMSAGELNVIAGEGHTTLGNDKRQFTTAFTYPSHGHIYIRLTPSAFMKFVCCWLGRIQDCYILHCQKAGQETKSFVAGQTLTAVDESDDS